MRTLFRSSAIRNENPSMQYPRESLCVSEPMHNSTFVLSECVCSCVPLMYNQFNWIALRCALLTLYHTHSRAQLLLLLLADGVVGCCCQCASGTNVFGSFIDGLVYSFQCSWPIVSTNIHTYCALHSHSIRFNTYVAPTFALQPTINRTS